MDLCAVGFDIDGTLYPDYKAWVRSVPFFMQNMKPLLAFSRTRRKMRELSGMSQLLSHPLETEAQIFAEEWGCPLEEARLCRDRLLYTEWQQCFEGMKPYRGVREALVRLKNAGLKLAALSDFPVGRKLEYFRVADLFDVVLGFPESGALKPRPEPFLKMARLLGVNPASTLYIGNKLEYDVQGAQNAGMAGALIGPPGLRAPKGITVYQNYRHLADSVLSEVIS